MNLLLLIKGSRVRVPPGSPKLNRFNSTSTPVFRPFQRFDPLIASELSTQIPFLGLEVSLG
jgi:hypothetical protein